MRDAYMAVTRVAATVVEMAVMRDELLDSQMAVLRAVQWGSMDAMSAGQLDDAMVELKVETRGAMRVDWKVAKKAEK